MTVGLLRKAGELALDVLSAHGGACNASGAYAAHAKTGEASRPTTNRTRPIHKTESDPRAATKHLRLITARETGNSHEWRSPVSPQDLRPGVQGVPDLPSRLVQAPCRDGNCQIRHTTRRYSTTPAPTQASTEA